MDNNEVAAHLEEIADLLELKGETVYRIGAYRNAARSIENSADSVRDLRESGRLREIPGIGESIEAKIGELLESGRIAYLEQLRSEVPRAMRALLTVPGLGPAKARLVHETLGISTIAELEAAAREHRLQELPGIREKTEEKILREIERLKQRTQRLLLGVALPAAEEVVHQLAGNPLVRQIQPAGSIRRMRETIGDIDLIASSEQPEELTKAFTELPIAREVIGVGPTKASILTRENLQIDLRVVRPEAYGAALQHFTGGKPHNIALREIAIRRGYKLNEYGLFDEATGERVAFEQEEDIYRALGMQWMPPEMRENRGEIDLAIAGRVPRLVEIGDLRGDFQMHTDWSDGLGTLRQMAEACAARGYEYAAITDHSQSLRVARGVSAERLIERLGEIDRLNEQMAPFRVLRSAEVDILRNGALDYPDELLGRLDIVVASIHTGFKMDREQMTDRIVTALRNPYVDILAHPTGRILLQRDGYDLNLERVIQVAVAEGVALEINAYPDRLDLDDIWAARAREMGATLCLSSDAHTVGQLDVMRYGVGVARRAWLEPKHLLNTLPVEKLLASRRPRRGGLPRAA